MCLTFAESPLTFAAHLDDTVEVIKVLKNGGAHLDFRAKDGLTAPHKAVRSKNLASLTVTDCTHVCHDTNTTAAVLPGSVSAARPCWSWELRRTTRTAVV